MTTAVQKKEDRNTLEAILKRPSYAERFKQVLGDKAAQFCSSLMSVGRELGEDTEPNSIIGSAMKAACLDLPIDKNLGFAWIVPYKKDGRKMAQFQMGFRGYVQLAQRTGYYAGMNACTVNEEAYKGRDALGEPIIDWDKLDETKPAVGYYFGFKMINGFVHGCFWTKAKVEAHAKKYSQAYRSNYDTPWKSHFDKMALKTVIANELSDWGIMSVQFQLARKADQGVTKDIDAETEYLDNEGPEQVEDKKEAHKPEPTKLAQAKESKKEPEKAPETPPAASTPVTTPAEAQKPASEPPVNADKPSNAPPESFENANPANSADAEEKEETAMGLAPVTTPATPPVAEPATPFAPNLNETPELQNVRYLLHKNGKTEEDLLPVLLAKKLRKENQKLADLAGGKLVNIGKTWMVFMDEMAKVKA